MTGKGNLVLLLEISYDKIHQLTNEEHAPYLVIPIIFIGLQPRHEEKEDGCSELIRILHNFSNKSA